MIQNLSKCNYLNHLPQQPKDVLFDGEHFRYRCKPYHLCAFKKFKFRQGYNYIRDCTLNDSLKLEIDFLK